MNLIILSKIKLKGFCIAYIITDLDVLKMKSKEIWNKRSKKHVILISQTAHTNPWIYRDPKLIMILAAWLTGGLINQRATHSVSITVPVK